MDRYNIGGTNYSEIMNAKTNQYNIMIRKAEIANRDNGGKPTKEEGNYYREAYNICCEIINMNLAQRAVVNAWTIRKKDCEAQVDRIVNALFPPPPPKPAEPAEAKDDTVSNNGKKPASKPGTTVKDSYGYTTTPSGFKTRNACKEVPAETIEKWYKDAPKHGFEDVTGMAAQKDLLMTKAGNLGWDQVDAALGISPVQSFFFYGPPGTGKTFLIEAFAHKMMDKGFKFIRLLGGDIHASLVGVAEKTVQIAFQEAIDNEPCIIFIDEIENVCVSRKKHNVEGHEKRLTVAFLEAYNLLKESGKRAIFMGATNYPSQVDEAMLDRITLVPVPLPDEEMRKDYFRRMFKRLPAEEGFSCEEMADCTDNYSFRDLSRLVETVNENIRKQAIAKYEIRDAEGKVDQKATDTAAAKAINDGAIRLTRALFNQVRESLPPSSKADSRAELEAFEAKVKGLVG